MHQTKLRPDFGASVRLGPRGGTRRLVRLKSVVLQTSSLSEIFKKGTRLFVRVVDCSRSQHPVSYCVVTEKSLRSIERIFGIWRNIAIAFCCNGAKHRDLQSTPLRRSFVGHVHMRSPVRRCLSSSMACVMCIHMQRSKQQRVVGVFTAPHASPVLQIPIQTTVPPAICTLLRLLQPR